MCIRPSITYHSRRGLVVNLTLFMPEALVQFPVAPDIFSFIETFTLKSLTTQDQKPPHKAPKKLEKRPLK